MSYGSKWEHICERCLDRAIELIEKNTTTDAATAEAVFTLTQTAILVVRHLEEHLSECGRSQAESSFSEYLRQCAQQTSPK